MTVADTVVSPGQEQEHKGRLDLHRPMCLVWGSLRVIKCSLCGIGLRLHIVREH